MKKNVWVGIYVVSVVFLVFTISFAAIMAMLASDTIITPGFVGFAIVAVVIGCLQFIVVHTILTLVVLYKNWSVIEDGVVSVTGGKAIGFLFIPFFNLYWIFRVWAGYPGEYNQYIERHKLSSPPIGNDIFSIFPLLVVSSAILLVPILLLPLVTVFLIARSCDAINNLELAKSALAEGKPLSSADFIGTPENPRSKKPVLALIGVLVLGGIIFTGFMAFIGANLKSMPKVDEMPPTVGDFRLEKTGDNRGSFFGAHSEFTSYMYVMNKGSNRVMVRYNLEPYWSESAAKSSTMGCEKGMTKMTVMPIKDSSGKEVGSMCSQNDGSVFGNIGRKYFWATQPNQYDARELKAEPATPDDIYTFIKSLPMSSGLVFPDRVPATTNTPISTKPRFQF